MTLTLDETQAKALLQLLNGRHQYNAGLDPQWMKALDPIHEQLHGGVLRMVAEAKAAHEEFLRKQAEPVNTVGLEVETPADE